MCFEDYHSGNDRSHSLDQENGESTMLSGGTFRPVDDNAYLIHNDRRIV